jgi:hypothetical protein
MTLEELRAATPKHSRSLITPAVHATFERLEAEDGEDFAEHYRQNFVSMSSVMKSGSYSMKDYISAVKFVAHKLLENSDIDAYHLTFPERYQRLMDKWTETGMEEDEVRAQKISPFVTAYKKGELVQKLSEQALMPSKILNAPFFQDPLNVQATLMYTARSEMVRMSAANSVLTYTAPNEVHKFEMDVGVKGSDEIQAMRDEMQRLALQQQTSIVSGINTSLAIAESKIMHEPTIEAEIE